MGSWSWSARPPVAHPGSPWSGPLTQPLRARTGQARPAARDVPRTDSAMHESSFKRPTCAWVCSGSPVPWVVPSPCDLRNLAAHVGLVTFVPVTEPAPATPLCPRPTPRAVTKRLEAPGMPRTATGRVARREPPTSFARLATGGHVRFAGGAHRWTQHEGVRERGHMPGGVVPWGKRPCGCTAHRAASGFS